MPETDPVTMRSSHDALRRARLRRGRADLGNRGFWTSLEPLYHLHMVERFGIDAMIDVGANEGGFLEGFRCDTGFAGPIVACEPQRRLHGKLAEVAARDPALTVVHAAIGAADGEAAFNLMGNHAFSSFHRPRPTGFEFDAAMNRIEAVETVPVRALGSLADELPMLKDARRIFLKTDTQGHDLEVLAGLGRLAPRIAFLQMELPVIPIYEDVPDLAECLAAAREAGFELCAVSPVSVHRHRVVELDCLFVSCAHADGASGLPGATA